MLAQLADRFVLFVAGAFHRQRQFRRDFLDGPSIQAELHDALLPWTEPFGGSLLDRIALLAELTLTRVLPVVHGSAESRGEAPAALDTFLDRVDGAEEFTTFLPFGLENLAPG